jgi:hypothetical protein
VAEGPCPAMTRHAPQHHPGQNPEWTQKRSFLGQRRRKGHQRGSAAGRCPARLPSAWQVPRDVLSPTSGQLSPARSLTDAVLKTSLRAQALSATPCEPCFGR